MIYAICRRTLSAYDDSL